MMSPPITRPRHVIVVAHPNPNSFVATIAEAYRETVEACGQEAIVRDLYALKFDPVLKDSERPGPELYSAAPDVRAELDVVAGCEALVLVYPIWFGAPPAILKGYIDRVLGYPVSVHGAQSQQGNGLLKGTRLLSISTSGADDVWLAEQGQERSIRTLFDHYIAHAFGMTAQGHLHLAGVVEGLAARFADQKLRDVKDRARHECAAIAAQHGGRAA